ncbi:MAG TPA: hypothetical protein VK470_18985 [Bacteroidota bacterium]|nr:hypothetical protein [Bacteroidota bacterium]
MNAHIISRLEDLIRKGTELMPEGGSEFSGYNAKKQSRYLLWRKNCLDAIGAIGDEGAVFSAKVTDDENGMYFYHSSVQRIVTVLEEAKVCVHSAIEAAELRAREEEKAREEQAQREAEARERERIEAEAREAARLEAEQDRLKAEALERERLEAEARERERLEAETRERERLEAETRERERLEAEAQEAARRAEEERQTAREAEMARAARETEEREAEAREEARKQIEALEDARMQEALAQTRREKELAVVRAREEAETAAKIDGRPKIFLCSLTNHVMLKQLQKFFTDHSLEYTLITHTDGDWSSLDSLAGGVAHFAVFLLSDRYHGQELMALGYIAGKYPSVNLCCIHAHTLALGDLLPGVSKKVFTVSFDEVKTGLVNELKATGWTVAN